jgi:soluble lytic murein transglycosylase-like protein
MIIRPYAHTDDRGAAMSSRFDHQFRAQAEVYFSDVRLCGQPLDWRWFKAQAMAESSMNPKAVSPAGAIGLMQLMPATSAEIARALNLPDQPFDPLLNIKFGIYYMLRMWRIFAQERDLERLRFAQGAYNAGAGSIIKAQNLANPPDQWWAIAQVLPRVTGIGNARQTTTYVKRVEAFYRELSC